MKRFFLTAMLSGLLAGMAPQASAEPVAYAFDPTHSFVNFELLHFNTSTIRGRFGPLQGDVVLDREARSGRVQVVVATTGLSTGLAVLDARIAQADLLATEEYPQAFFVAERFEFDAQGEVSAVAGEFTLRGSSQPLRLVAQRFRCYTHPLLRREVCGGDFEGKILRSSFDMSFGMPFVADEVRLKIQVEAVRQTP
jgi:polyisoprenoid-binding protein YceI